MKGWLEWGRKLWQCGKHFEEVLTGGKEMTKEMLDGRVRSGGEGNGLLSKCVTREEVVWGLQKFNMKETAAWEEWQYSENDE